jgi:FkbM family methyltransferase
VLREVFIDRQYAPLQIFPDHSVNTIVDLGANIGLSLCFWSQQYPSAHLFAVEPDRENAKICTLNCALWGITDRVLLIEACIGRESGHAWLDRGAEPWAYRLSHSSTPVSSQTEVLSMSDFLNRAQIEGRIDILKCDIEGGEAELMSTCQDWLDRVDVMIMELHAPYSVDRLKKDLVHSLSKFALVVREQKGVAFVILNRLAASFAEQ